MKVSDIDDSKGKRIKFHRGLNVDLIKDKFKGAGIFSFYKSLLGENIIEKDDHIYISPLHIAISNTRSVGIILQYMAKIENSSWDIISDVID